MRLLAISGSLRDHAGPSAVARAVARVAPAGVDVEVWRDPLSLPLYNNDDLDDDYCDAAARLREAVRRVDAVVVCGRDAEGVPASLKNVLEWLRSNLGDTPVLAVVVDYRDTARAASELAATLTALGAHVASLQLDATSPIFNRSWELDHAGALDQLRAATAALVAAASANPQRVAVKAALARAYAERAAATVHEDIQLRWTGDEPPLVASGRDAIAALFAGGGSATYGALQLVWDTAGRGVLLEWQGSTGNPRDGFSSSYEFETVGGDGWSATGELAGDGWEDVTAHRLTMSRSFRVHARSDAGLAAARAIIAAAFTKLGFAVDTK
jgi:NAD(P)H-dependent FMN reductase